MFRKRINNLLEQIGEVLDDFHHLGYEVLHYERPKPHPNPKFKNALQLVITLNQSGCFGIDDCKRYDMLLRGIKKDHEEYCEKISKDEKE